MRRSFAEDFVCWHDWFHRQPVVQCLNTLRYIESQRSFSSGERSKIRALGASLLVLILVVLFRAPIQVICLALVALTLVAITLCSAFFARTPFGAILLFVQWGIPLLLLSLGSIYFAAGFDASYPLV